VGMPRTSMGRLTLNVLLSFAQFDREVIGERIRDKIAASKKKGMWMGGVPPLGYGVQNHKLVVIDSEADTCSIDLPPLCRTRLTPIVTGGARSSRDQK
jgi:DNA invertase Pin-like site-specific DNA recombinase